MIRLQREFPSGVKAKTGLWVSTFPESETLEHKNANGNVAKRTMYSAPGHFESDFSRKAKLVPVPELRYKDVEDAIFQSDLKNE